MDMDYTQEGYYSVKVAIQDEVIVHTVYARSDYDAAIKVRQTTGLMPKNDHDVSFLAPRLFFLPTSGLLAV